VEAGNAGFQAAIKGSAVQVVETKYGDTGKEVQSKLVEDTLQAHPDISYIVGTAVTAEAAVPILKSRGLQNKVKVISYYYTPGVHQGIGNGSIMAAPTDSTVIQGRIAIDQAVRILEGKDYLKHVGPRCSWWTNRTPRASTPSPRWRRPTSSRLSRSTEPRKGINLG